MIGAVPEFDLADRVRKALRFADIDVGKLSKELDVHRNTVGNWINGRWVPSRASLLAIAHVTGVDIDWLADGSIGQMADIVPIGGAGLPLMDSNHQPAGYQFALVLAA